MWQEDYASIDFCASRGLPSFQSFPLEQRLTSWYLDLLKFVFLENMHAAAAAKLLQLCPTMRPLRRQPTRFPRPWDSPVKNTGVGCHFLLQCMKVKSLSRVRLPATPWTAAYQAPPSMGFSRQEFWSGVPLPSPNMLSNTLSRLVITFLPRSKHLLISWLQSPSASVPLNILF